MTRLGFFCGISIALALLITDIEASGTIRRGVRPRIGNRPTPMTSDTRASPPPVNKAATPAPVNTAPPPKAAPTTWPVITFIQNQNTKEVTIEFFRLDGQGKCDLGARLGNVKIRSSKSGDGPTIPETLDGICIGAQASCLLCGRSTKVVNKIRNPNNPDDKLLFIKIDTGVVSPRISYKISQRR